MNDVLTSIASSPAAASRAAVSVNETAAAPETSPAVQTAQAETAPVEAPELNLPSAEEIFAAADRVTAFLQENNTTRALHISMNEDLDRAVFTVVDAETNEIIRHIPSDEVVAMAKYIEQWTPDPEDVMPQGILFDSLV